MEKGDWGLIIIILVVLIIIAIVTTNMDRLFPTPTVKEAAMQAINAVNATLNAS